MMLIWVRWDPASLYGRGDRARPLIWRADQAAMVTGPATRALIGDRQLRRLLGAGHADPPRRQSVEPVAVSVSVSVCTKLPFAVGPLWATRSASTNSGGGFSQRRKYALPRCAGSPPTAAYWGVYSPIKRGRSCSRRPNGRRWPFDDLESRECRFIVGRPRRPTARGSAATNSREQGGDP